MSIRGAEGLQPPKVAVVVRLVGHVRVRGGEGSYPGVRDDPLFIELALVPIKPWSSPGSAPTSTKSLKSDAVERKERERRQEKASLRAGSLTVTVGARCGLDALHVKMLN